MADADDLALDLHSLWFTANSLREMGTAHTESSSTVAGCRPMSAQMRPPSIGLGSTGFHDDWSALQDKIIDMLHTNARSLNDTADALDMCVERFVNADEDVRSELDHLKATIPYE
jgi:hypothetical protein